MQSLLRFVIDHPVTVSMVTLAMMVFGIVSFARLPIELLPELSYPTLTVQVELPDAAPEEVEQLLTLRIEPVIGVVGGLKRYHSTSRAGVSEITLEFGWNTDMSLAALDVREKLDLVELPVGARSPIVYRFDPSLDPVLRVALLQPSDARALNIRDLRHLAETAVQQQVERIPGVAAAKVVGGAEEEVRVEVDEGRLAALGLTIETIALRIGEENINRSGGELREAGAAYMLRTVKEFRDLDDMLDTVIRASPAGDVTLRDLATARFAMRDEEVLVRVGGVPAVELHVYKEGDANTVSVSREVRRRLEEFGRDRRFSGISARVLFDQARFIEDAVDNVTSAVLQGAVLSSLVLFFFLRDLLATLLISLAVPISVAATFLCMRFLGISLNVMSLGGIALGVGMVVDSSVVVLESVRRRFELGESGVAPVLEGTRQVVTGLIASTLTTVLVFLPLIFVEGVAGQLFRDQALVVTFSMLAALVVAVTLIPCVLASRLASPTGWLARGSKWIELPFRPFLWLFDRALRRFSRGYERVLNRITVRRWGPLFATAVLALIVLPRARELGLELVPNLFQGEFYYDLELAEGTSIEETDAKVRAMEDAVLTAQRTHLLPIQHCHASVGGTPVLGDVRAGDRQEHIARVSISLLPGTRAAQEAETIHHLDRAFAALPDCAPKLGRPTLFTFRSAIEVEVYGDDLDSLMEGAEDTARRLRELNGFADVQSGVPPQSPEVHVELDSLKLARFDLSQGQVAATLAAKGLGVIATQYTAGDKPIDVRVQVRGMRRGDRRAVERALVRADTEPESRVPLAAIGQLVTGTGPVEIRRINGERACLVGARLDGRDLGGAAQDVEGVLAKRYLPPGVSAKLSGQHKEMRESLGSLLFALGLAIFLVYLLLASCFESLTMPFIIVLTVPVGLIGAVAALYVTATPVGAIAMIGLILLTGIVVNNGIIYIERILQLRAAGLEPGPASVRAGLERLRPILITSSTTVLGLMPMALGYGAGAELQAPLAVTVCGGLTLATLLALIVVPSGYLVLGGRSGGRAPNAAAVGGESS
ncbi:MAG: efflux RND transporter permease subunit [Planctomycetota bacterium]